MLSYDMNEIFRKRKNEFTESKNVKSVLAKPTYTFFIQLLIVVFPSMV